MLGKLHVRLTRGPINRGALGHGLLVLSLTPPLVMKRETWVPFELQVVLYDREVPRKIFKLMDEANI